MNSSEVLPFLAVSEDPSQIVQLPGVSEPRKTSAVWPERLVDFSFSSIGRKTQTTMARSRARRMLLLMMVVVVVVVFKTVPIFVTIVMLVMVLGVAVVLEVSVIMSAGTAWAMTMMILSSLSFLWHPWVSCAFAEALESGASEAEVGAGGSGGGGSNLVLAQARCLDVHR